MSTIDVRGVSFAYSDSVPLLTDVRLALTPGWYGLVGPNGAGKTTLLRLLARELVPDRGELRVRPHGLRAVLCAQTLEDPPGGARAFATSTEPDAHRLVGRLGLDPAELERWPTLSPGERKRWQVAVALASTPGILLLDEPTNHLDAAARDWLVGALHRFPGIGLIVSHDRVFLDALTTSTIRFWQGEVRLYRGGYGVARRSWEGLERERVDAYARIRGEERKLRRRLADRRHRHRTGHASLSALKRKANPRDIDLRKRLQATHRRMDASVGRQIQRIRGRLERTREELGEFRFRRSLGRSLFVGFVRAPMPVLASVDELEIRAGDRLLLRSVRVALGREGRVRVVGPNGIGKSTLLRSLLDRSCIPPARLLYLPQELQPDEERVLLEDVRALPPDERGRVLSFVAALGVDPETLLRSGRPSPGEARKLALASGLGRRVWALVLDEPTNHLDLPSIERLEGALEAYPGALVLVTHDDGLARRCTATRWELHDGRVFVRTEPEGEPSRA